MNCLYCNKEFSCVSNLNRHRRVTKCSRGTQCETCNQYYVNIAFHLPICIEFLKNKVIELEKTNEDLQKTNDELKKDLMTRHGLANLAQQLEELINKVDTQIIGHKTKLKSRLR